MTEPTTASPLPYKIAALTAATDIFERADTIRGEAHGAPTLDLEMLRSSDGKVVAGIYESGPCRFSSAGWDCDEFMQLLAGTITLTSQDGGVMHIGPGDAVAIPLGWAGTWESGRYRKYYVIHMPDGVAG